MGKDEDRPRKHVKVIEIRETDIEEIVGSELPVRRVDVNVGGNRKGIVFTVSRKSVDAAKPGWLQELGQTLGNLVHPHPATLIVLPAGEKLSAYEVSIADGDPRLVG